MRLFLLVAGLLVFAGTAAARLSCDGAASDSRVIYGKVASSTPPRQSALILCRRVKGGSETASSKRAAATPKDALEAKNHSAEQAAILRQELARSRQQLAEAQQRQHQGAALDPSATRRIEEDVAALRRELERLGYPSP
ncbi:MAG: hypothetical protein LBP52_02410 [Burkholderiaceae bacterium]|jgi:hypothetical protein|nr:hypothetical protein [Burkholderiaceae bacterium]